MKLRENTYLFILVSFVLSIVIVSCTIKGQDNSAGESISLNTKKEIVVFAGASMTNALTEIADSFKIQTGITVKTNMASSGTLARQIEHGAVPDIYISANSKWAEYVDSLGYNATGIQKKVAKNKLQLIAPLSSTLPKQIINNTTDFTSLLKTGRLSIGDPAHVPAGRYAKQSLEHYKWYKKLSNKILPAKDVRSALMIVEMEEAPLGIVYQTDATLSKKVKVLATFPEESHPPINFVAIACKANRPSLDFFTFLNSNKAKEIWARHGFSE